MNGHLTVEPFMCKAAKLKVTDQAAVFAKLEVRM